MKCLTIKTILLKKNIIKGLKSKCSLYNITFIIILRIK